MSYPKWGQEIVQMSMLKGWFDFCEKQIKLIECMPLFASIYPVYGSFFKYSIMALMNKFSLNVKVHLPYGMEVGRQWSAGANSIQC